VTFPRADTPPSNEYEHFRFNPLYVKPALIPDRGVVKNRVTLWSDQVVSEFVVIPPFSEIAPYEPSPFHRRQPIP
jgi:hypothetical protein